MSEQVLGLRIVSCKGGFGKAVPVPVVLLSWLDKELVGWIKFTKKNKFASPETVASVEILCFKLYADACKKAETENNSRLVKRTGFYKPKLVKKEGRK